MTRVSEPIIQESFTRAMILRAVAKALCLFVIFNLIYGGIQPVDNGLLPSLYNSLLSGRTRLVKGYEYDPYRLISDHAISHASSETFNIAFMGSSEIWGLRATPATSIPATLDGLGLVAADGRPVRVYNLGYPIPNGLKDLSLLEVVMRQHIPIDLVILSAFETTFEVYTHDVLSANYPLQMQTLTHYGLTPIASRIITAAPQEGPLPEWNDKDALSAWLSMQMRGLMWSLIGDDVDSSVVNYRQAVRPMTQFAAPLENTEPRPEIVAAFAQFSRERGIPVILVAAPVPIENNPFALWLQQNAQSEGLPLIDCWHLFERPQDFENFYHIMLEQDAPYASVLVKHLSESSLSHVMGLPLTPPSDFVRPTQSCTVYPFPDPDS